MTISKTSAVGYGLIAVTLAVALWLATGLFHKAPPVKPKAVRPPVVHSQPAPKPPVVPLPKPKVVKPKAPLVIKPTKPAEPQQQQTGLCFPFVPCRQGT